MNTLQIGNTTLTVGQTVKSEGNFYRIILLSSDYWNNWIELKLSPNNDPNALDFDKLLADNNWTPTNETL